MATVDPKCFYTDPSDTSTLVLTTDGDKCKYSYSENKHPPKCHFTMGDDYNKNFFTEKNQPKGIILCFRYNKNENNFLNSFVWPSEESYEKDYIKTLLGDYKINNWNYPTYLNFNYMSGLLPVYGLSCSFETLPENNISSSIEGICYGNYLTVFVDLSYSYWEYDKRVDENGKDISINDRKRGGMRLFCETAYLVAYLCEKYQINPLGTWQNIPTVTCVEEVCALNKMDKNFYPFYDINNINRFNLPMMRINKKGYIMIEEDYDTEKEKRKGLSQLFANTDQVNLNLFRMRVFQSLVPTQTFQKKIAGLYEGKDFQKLLSTKGTINKILYHESLESNVTAHWYDYFYIADPNYIDQVFDKTDHADKKDENNKKIDDSPATKNSNYKTYTTNYKGMFMKKNNDDKNIWKKFMFIFGNTSMKNNVYNDGLYSLPWLWTQYSDIYQPILDFLKDDKIINEPKENGKTKTGKAILNNYASININSYNDDNEKYFKNKNATLMPYALIEGDSAPRSHFSSRVLPVFATKDLFCRGIVELLKQHKKITNWRQ